MDIEVKNDFHGTSTTLRVPQLPYTLSEGQMDRCWKALCGIDGCCCGGELGERGSQGYRFVMTGSGRVMVANH